MRPSLITFTGVDEHTNPETLFELSNLYPIEFGILIGDRKSPRYPNFKALPKFAQTIKFSCHFCGRYSNDILRADFQEASEILIERGIYFERAQINSREQPIDLEVLQMFAEAFDVQTIWQTRASAIDYSYFHHRYPDVKVLFDKSGGRGETPDAWPTTSGHYMGFAGGIGPHNVRSVLESINHKGPFWIDMETHVRDNNDLFDLDKVRRVCEIVYDED